MAGYVITTHGEQHSTFKFSLDQLVESLEAHTKQGADQHNKAVRRYRIILPRRLTVLQYVFLVGGFAASPYLFEQAAEIFKGQVHDLRRANSNT